VLYSSRISDEFCLIRVAHLSPPHGACNTSGRVAQLAEHSALNRQVEGSIPSASTKLIEEQNSFSGPSQKIQDFACGLGRPQTGSSSIPSASTILRKLICISIHPLNARSCARFHPGGSAVVR
jgi:hypothetical protein